MQGITQGSMKTTYAWLAVAIMIAVPQIQAAMDTAEGGEPINWVAVLLSIAVAVAGYFTRDNDVSSKNAGAET